ncbi:glutathione S-transferase family protein [Chamaesiphon polymorphus]|uniref:Glutathione S-transferase n=1 Tax=Chamaesiphon polymorphus CCALA 037 TaxID=2107692 RepID=A0A2T1GBR9_9CYAN|nr:glutathione S-transferase N-terminal domain-containing protein [Chamaesiphon polymorphus]PSB54780.1 glutathione S-transferase [Chamaesiphon polymorphus CCALA 037]
MYTIYTFPTPNGIKVPIALEELNLEYKLHPVNIRQGGQREADFVAVNPAGKVPVLIDENTTGDRFTLTESAAILVFLAEKHGKLLPTEPIDRAQVFEQLFFHASGLSPAFGQSGYFQKLASEPMPLAIARFHGEAKRTLGLLDSTLAQRAYVAGDDYSIADIAHFGWLWRRAFAGVEFDNAPNVARWYESIAARPAVLSAISKVETLAA